MTAGSKFLVVNVRTLKEMVVDLDEAARITELDPDEIEWAIEQVGRCDVEDWAILPEGATYMPYDSGQSRSQSAWPKLVGLSLIAWNRDQPPLCD